MGSQSPGEPCISGGLMEATDDCDGTSFCWDVNNEGVGICRAFCTGSADDPQCPPGSQCSVSSEATILLCIPDCDPILQDCGPGLACYWTNNNGFYCIFTMQDIPVGQPCEFINDCEIGLGCLTAEILPACEGSACCSPFCALELGDGPCDAAFPGTACVPFFEEPPPGYEHIGICILPP
jgi:hypothetical protein